MGSLTHLVTPCHPILGTPFLADNLMPGVKVVESLGY